jgi:hypothetical protein
MARVSCSIDACRPGDRIRGARQSYCDPGGCVRGSLQKRREPLAAEDVASLRSRAELAPIHVLDHTLAQRGDSLGCHRQLPSWMRFVAPRSSRQGASPATDDLPSGDNARIEPHPSTIAKRFSALAHLGCAARCIPASNSRPLAAYPEINACRLSAPDGLMAAPPSPARLYHAATFASAKGRLIRWTVPKSKQRSPP